VKLFASGKGFDAVDAWKVVDPLDSVDLLAENDTVSVSYEGLG
jgi:hypothetical protein